MKATVWIGVVTLLVIVSGILGNLNRSYNAPQNTSPSFLSQQQVVSDIQKQQLTQNKIAQNIRVIHMDTKGNEGFSFATFDVNGKQEFASLIISPTGYGMSTYTMGTDKVVPIQWITQSTDGFEYITGGIFHHPNVKRAVVIWTDGTAVTVPVRNGFFWCEHKVQMSTKIHVKQVIGITSSGAIVQSPIKKGQ